MEACGLDTAAAPPDSGENFMSSGWFLTRRTVFRAGVLGAIQAGARCAKPGGR